jgi:hypothetical protein
MAGARHRLLLSAGLLLLLGGCSGTPFGDQLSRSFSNPGAPASGTAARLAANPAAPTTPGATASGGAAPATGTPGQPATRAANPIPAQDTKATPKQGAKTATATTLQPAPYRVTIKLPSADPSAPAEVVTQALRAAGVSFEVEMIERVRGNGAAAPAAPVVTPAPAPR